VHLLVCDDRWILHVVYYIRNAESNEWKARVRHSGQFEVLEYLRKIEKIFREEYLMPRKELESDILQANHRNYTEPTIS
jgi:alkyl sulfatase BDS1-like metallo-beta-lactamase superfamily hydrolase